MLKWKLRIAITVIDLVLLALLWWVAEWPNPLAWFRCDEPLVVAQTEMTTGEAVVILQASGAWDEDMSGD
jgi:hypothetical protein